MSAVEHPYSPAVRAGETVYVSGALSVDPSGVAVPGRRAALDAAVARMTERLAGAGGELADIVKTTYFVTDISLRDGANAQFLDLFAEPGRCAPSSGWRRRRTYGATVEIDVIARIRRSES
ncbi:RidA family protein [Streptomyces sp. NPDC056309]|uniref:RidA family protein n=1 Tax=unclassified Streptomyces TaxID=2593676 RepID=UPI0035D736CF